MRLFLGVKAPPGPGYAQMTRFLRERHTPFRPVPHGSWHVTLRFLGNADVEKVCKAVAPAVEGVHSIPVVVRGLGGFPQPERARVVWAGVTAGGIEDLANRLRDATPMRDDPDKGRPFHAHVTLGRSAQPLDIRRSIDDMAHVQFGEAWFNEVTLFASITTSAGPRYEVVRRFPLIRMDPEDPGLPRWARHFPWRGEPLSPPEAAASRKA